MPFWMLIAIHGPRLLCAPEGEAGGGGGNPPAKADPAQGGQTDLAKQLAELTAQNKALLERMEKYEKKGAPPDDPDLRDKAIKEREAGDKKIADHKQLENALKFSLGADSWLKANQSLLPKDVADIFKTAEKENFANAIEKDQAIKSGIIQSFFSVQSNLDLLTPGIKQTLDDYLKLTKNGKAERAQIIYDTVFEPAFEMLRRVKKAEALSKGFGSATDVDDQYKQKMINLSRKHYLRENK